MITDCMRRGLSPRLLAIAGRAVLTMVVSSVCMKKPVATSHRRKRSDLSGGMVMNGIRRQEFASTGACKRCSIGIVLQNFRRLSDASTLAGAGEYPGHSNVARGKTRL
jgi:hypothetical protein